MCKQFKIRSVLGLAFLAFSSVVFAAPQVTLEVLAEKDVVEVNKKGKEIKKRVVAENIVPGDTLFYTISYKNSGDETAINVQIDNPIPAGTVYQDQSAGGENSQVLFSIDAGKSFKTASNLTYEVKDEKGKVKTQAAKPEQYNVIRWVVADIPANGKGSVGFSVVVK